MNSLLKTLFKKLMLVLAGLIIFAAVLLSLTRAFTPLLAEHNADIASWFSKLIHHPVKIGAITAGWHGLEPVIKLSNVSLQANKQSQVKIKSLEVGINFWSSLNNWQIKPGAIFFMGSKIDAYQLGAGNINVAGITTFNPFDDNDDILRWLTTVEHIGLKNINIIWHEQNGQTMRFSNMKLELTNSPDHMNIWGQASLAPIQSKTQPSMIKLIATIDGDFSDKKNLVATAYFKGKKIPIKEYLKGKKFAGLQITDGNAKGQLWLTWKKNQLQALQTIMAIQNLTFLNKEKKATNNAPVKINSVTAHLAWEHDKMGGWELNAHNIRVTTNRKNWPNAKLSIHMPANQKLPAKNKGLQKAKIYLSQLQLQEIAPLLLNSNLLPNRLKEALKNIQPQGVLSNLYITYDPTKPRQSMVVRGQLNNVALHHWRYIPTMSGLNSQFNFKPDAGRVVLSDQHSDLDFGKLFSNKLAIDQFNSIVTWNKDNRGWHVGANNININLPNEKKIPKDVTIHGNIAVTIPPKGNAPVLKLLLGASNMDVNTVKRYFPVGIMDPDLSHWLKTALVSGAIQHPRLLFDGTIKDFPFDHHTGTFIADAGLKNIDLKYAPDWPDLKKINGELRFSGRTMKIRGDSATIFRNHIKSITATIPDLAPNHHPKLQITSQLEGNLANGLSFLRQSPLKNKVGKAFDGVQLKGPMALNLQLNIPLLNINNNIQAKGSVETDAGQIDLSDWGINVKNINGRVQFDNQTVFARNIQIELLKQPALLNVTTITKGVKTPLTQIEIFGKANGDALQPYLKLPLLSNIKGTTNYRAVLQLHNDNTTDSLDITSNMVGLSLPFPKPFYKPTQKVLPTEFNMYFNGSNPVGVHFNYGKILSAALTYQKTKDGLKFTSGNIHLGSTKAIFQKEKGMLVDGSLEEFDWAKWSPFFPTISPPVAKKKLDPNYHPITVTDIKKLLRAIDVKLGIIKVYGQQLVRTQAEITPGKQNWLIHLNGPVIAGDINLPYPSKDPKRQQTINARLKRLYLHADDTSSKTFKLPNTPPTLLPLNVTVDDFRYSTHVLGKAKLITAPIKNGLKIKELEVNPGIYQFTAKGDWIEKNGKPQTSLQGSLQSNDIASTLQTLGFSPFIIGNDGKINFDLNWPGAPYAPSKKNLSGKVVVKMKMGRIASIGKEASEEMNLGRMLTLLSFKSIPRRLTLNFNDLTSSGFSFDSLSGDFTLSNGAAITENSQLNGIVANIQLHGSIDYLTKRYDIFTAITPHVTSSLPVIATVAATIAGGPLAGAVTGLAGKFISGAVNTMATRYYKITGPWSKPKFQPTKVVG